MARLMWCVTISSVLPARIWRMESITARSVSMSRAAVASSITSSSKSLYNARARAIR